MLINENHNLLQQPMQLTSVILSDEVRCRRESGLIVDDNEIVPSFTSENSVRLAPACSCGPLVSRCIVETMYASERLVTTAWSCTSTASHSAQQWMRCSSSSIRRYTTSLSRINIVRQTTPNPRPGGTGVT